MNQGGKKLAALDKRSYFNQDVLWDEIEGSVNKRKIVQPQDDIDFQSDSNSADGIYNATVRGCGSKLSLEQDLDQSQCIEAHLKSYLGSIKRTSVNFNNREKQRQYYSSSITPKQHYSFDLAICFTSNILFTILSFRQSLFYRYLISNITSFLLEVSSGSILWSTVASAFSNKSEILRSQLV